MKDHGIPLLKDEVADSFMTSLNESKLKPYTDQQKKKDNKNIEGVLTKEQVEQIFTYGINYQLVKSNPNVDFGQFPTDNFDKVIDYVYRLIVENERDEECLRCGRYYTGSCIGTINRGRETITDGNRCAAFYKREYNFKKD